MANEMTDVQYVYVYPPLLGTMEKTNDGSSADCCVSIPLPGVQFRQNAH